MATRAANHKARAAANEDSKSGTPKQWWQWILLYPAFAVALLTAGPQWYDRASAAIKGIKGGSVTDAEKQAALWRKNLSCSAAPFAWYSNPSNVKIDATICDSGDIFVRASTPENGNFFKWVPLDDVLRSAQSGGGMIPAANAASLSLRAGPQLQLKPAGMLVALQAATVLCQHFIDDRHILRRVQTPQGCFDEVIDTYNGSVVKRTPAPCSSQC
jgi:hypothetical protein